MAKNLKNRDFLFLMCSAGLLVAPAKLAADIVRTLSNYEKDLAELAGGKPTPKVPTPLRPPAQKGFLDLVSNKRAQHEASAALTKELEQKVAALRSEVAQLDEECRGLHAAIVREEKVATRQDQQLRELREEGA